MRDAIDTKTLRAAFVQAQAQIMNNGTYTPVVVIDKGMALQLLDEIERQQRWIEEATPLLDDWNALARESFEALSLVGGVSLLHPFARRTNECPWQWRPADLGEPAHLLGVWGSDVVRALIDSLRRPVENPDA